MDFLNNFLSLTQVESILDWMKREKEREREIHLKNGKKNLYIYTFNSRVDSTQLNVKSLNMEEIQGPMILRAQMGDERPHTKLPWINVLCQQKKNQK